MISETLILAPAGELKIAWVRRNMPVLRGIEAGFAAEKPFAGMKIALSSAPGGKDGISLPCGSPRAARRCTSPARTPSPLRTTWPRPWPPGGMEVHATHGATAEEYEKQLEAVLAVGPNIIIDDGGELVELMRTKFADLVPNVIGGCEETTTGITRLRKLHRDG